VAFGWKAVSCLGHVVSKDGIPGDHKKIEDIVECERPTSVQLIRSWLSLMVTNKGSLRDFTHCPACHRTNVEECSSCLERTMRNKRSGAKGKTGLRTCPHIAHEIFGARSANVWIPKKDWDV
jgi:hypothetical protein